MCDRPQILVFRLWFLLFGACFVVEFPGGRLVRLGWVGDIKLVGLVQEVWKRHGSVVVDQLSYIAFEVARQSFMKLCIEDECGRRLCDDLSDRHLEDPGKHDAEAAAEVLDRLVWAALKTHE